MDIDPLALENILRPHTIANFSSRIHRSGRREYPKLFKGESARAT